MALSIKLSGTEYVLKDTYTIRQQAGAVSLSDVDVRIDNNAVPQVMQDAQIFLDDVPFFFGYVQSVESPEFNSGIEVKCYRLSIQSAEVIFNNRFASEAFTGKYTHEIVQTLFTNYIEGEGITLGNISTTERYYEKYNFSYTRLSDILRELADDIGASYFVDGDKKFYFIVRDSFQQVTPPEHINGLKCEKVCADIRTVQIVTGAVEETSTQTEATTWQASQTVMVVGYQISSITGMTINGTLAGVGTLGVDEANTAVTFLYAVGSQNITLNANAATKPTTGDTVAVVYKGYYDIIVTVENDQLKEQISTLNGTSGRIEALHTDETIDNFQDADTLAANLLSEKSECEQTISCDTFDMTASQIFNMWYIDRPTLGIQGMFVVTERVISDYFDKYKIKIKLKNRGFYSRYGTILNQGEKRKGEDIVIYKQSTFGDTVNTTETLSIDNAGVLFYPTTVDYLDPILGEFYPV